MERLGGKKVQIYEKSNGFDLIYKGKKLNYINFDNQKYLPKVTLKELEKNWPDIRGASNHWQKHPWKKTM